MGWGGWVLVDKDINQSWRNIQNLFAIVSLNLLLENFHLEFITMMQGAGHTVPEYKPREALEFYTRWLEGKNI